MMMNERVNTPLLCLIGVLVVKALMMAGVILYAGIGLGPDEAQYWTWSQDLALGYYSKPPAIAWQIGLGAYFFGNTEFGVRFGSLIIAFGLSLAVYRLAICCGLKSWTAFWSGVTMAITPLGLLGSFLATTDGGYLLFWTLACASMADSLRKQESPNLIAIAVFLLCGALFKWTIYLFWFFCIVFWPYHHQRLILQRLVGGVLISLLGMVPTVIWNATHEWATFRHVSATLQGGSVAHKVGGNLLEWIGAQAVLISPILFVLLVIAAIICIKRWKNLSEPLKFCAAISISSFIAMSVFALFQKTQGNWGIFAYPTAIVVLCWYLCEEVSWGKNWLKGGLALSFVLFFTVVGLAHTMPYRMSPFRHNTGWPQLENTLQKVGYKPDQDFLFSDKYQTTSLLSFYSERQKRAYFFNLHMIRKNQFSYWPGMKQEQMGKTGFFVWVENTPHWQKEKSYRLDEYQKMLQEYFSNVQLVWDGPIFYSGSIEAKGALIFKCTDYNGNEPQELKLF